MTVRPGPGTTRIGRTHVTCIGQTHVTRIEQTRVTRIGQTRVTRIGRTHVTCIGQTRVTRIGQTRVTCIGQTSVTPYPRKDRPSEQQLRQREPLTFVLLELAVRNRLLESLLAWLCNSIWQTQCGITELQQIFTNSALWAELV